MSMREVLISMGYREDKAQHWVKPVGVCLFLFREESREWENWFKQMDGQVTIYEGKTFAAGNSDEDNLAMLKYYEAFTRIDMAYESGSQFQLSAIDL